MSSGPRAGLGEIHLPDLQPGSSIMPGKVNPVVPEATLMVCAQVIGNDATITMAGASGSFELNVMLPVIGRDLLESLTLPATAARLLADRCIDGITADEERCRDLAEGSPSIVTPLNRYLGYEAAAAVAKQSIKERRTIRDVVVSRGHVAAGDLTEAAARRGARRAGHGAPAPVGPASADDSDPQPLTGACGSLSACGGAVRWRCGTISTSWWPGSGPRRRTGEP